MRIDLVEEAAARGIPSAGRVELWEEHRPRVERAIEALRGARLPDAAEVLPAMIDGLPLHDVDRPLPAGRRRPDDPDELHAFTAVVDDVPEGVPTVGLKDMIAVGGFKVFPSQIEAILYHHPAVREALVIGMADTYRGEVPRAYVTLTEEAGAVDGAALRDWLNPQLGKHERVDRVVVRASLPKTMIGKLSRKDLVAEIRADTEALLITPS